MTKSISDEAKDNEDMLLGEDPLLDEMLIKAEQLRMAMLVATNPIPRTIETDHMTECSSVEFTVFSSTSKRLTDAPAAVVVASPRHQSTSTISTSKQQVKNANVLANKDALKIDWIDEPVLEVEDEEEEKCDLDGNASPTNTSSPPGLDAILEGSPMAASPPEEEDENSVAAFRLACEWTGIAAVAPSTTSIARKGDVDFSPVADYYGNAGKISTTVRGKYVWRLAIVFVCLMTMAAGDVGKGISGRVGRR